MPAIAFYRDAVNGQGGIGYFDGAAMRFKWADNGVLEDDANMPAGSQWVRYFPAPSPAVAYGYGKIGNGIVRLIDAANPAKFVWESAFQSQLTDTPTEPGTFLFVGGVTRLPDKGVVLGTGSISGGGYYGLWDVTLGQFWYVLATGGGLTDQSGVPT